MYLSFEKQKELIGNLKQNRLLFKLLKPYIKAEAILPQVDEQIDEINKTLELLKSA